jgi:ACT domain-containing protein
MLSRDVALEQENKNRIQLKFSIVSIRMFERQYDLVITLEFDTAVDAQSVHDILLRLRLNALTKNKDIHVNKTAEIEFKLAAEQEKIYQFIETAKRHEGVAIIEKAMNAKKQASLSMAMSTWASHIAEINAVRMESDKLRWRLHAATNIDNDLQAWYHSAFSNEIYRLKGAFWYRDALLPTYKDSYGLVESHLTPLEEAALSHILCSPGTTYGDVAGQMFTVQAMVDASLYALFSTLCSNGSLATKYPRSGRPSKKLFRFSFVEGSIYLTWKGKAGNTGVDLADVSHVTKGLSSDILRSKGNTEHENRYLSLFSIGRSVDLYFDTESERDNWFHLLETLVQKEQKRIYDMIGVEDPAARSEQQLSPEDSIDILFFKAIVGGSSR